MAISRDNVLIGRTVAQIDYLRLDITVHDGRRAVIRVAARKLTPRARGDPAHRAARHRFYRQMLTYHREAQQFVRTSRL